MFNFFKKRKSKLSITKEDKSWVEENFLWFIENFGFLKTTKKSFYLPSDKNLQFKLDTNDNIENAFNILCEYWEVDRKMITIKIFDDIKSKQWTDWMPEGEIDEPSGRYIKKGNFYYVEIAKSVLQNPSLFVSVVSHELSHVRLLGDGYLSEKNPDIEFITDLFVIFYGFGVFLANSCETRNLNWISKNGYLPNEVISYANALLCYFSKEDFNKIAQELNSNTKSLFVNDFKYIKETQDILLTPNAIDNCNKINILFKDLDEFINQNNYTEAEKVCQKLIQLKPKESASYINLGEVLLKQKKYKDAINNFNKAIDIDPFNYSIFNSRSYCLLQLKDFENALIDLETSDELNPKNSYLLRNYGVFYLLKKEPKKALSYFLKAYKANSTLNLINFYLYNTYKELNNTKEATKFKRKHIIHKEFNDSLLAF